MADGRAGGLTKKQLGRFGKANDACRIHPVHIPTLARYVEACIALTGTQPRYWFRGHSKAEYPLTPSALRYDTESERTTALRSVDDFKRIALTKLPQAPALDENLQWIQLARHYGLPTRLLDWTQNAAIGLYFACAREDFDGLVFVLDPIEMNMALDKDEPRVFDAQRDRSVIEPYLKLTGRIVKGGSPTIAINPILNSERLILQKGTFTLHGAGEIAITNQQVPSLSALPILREHKSSLLRELALVGIDEMSIFPEPEHICAYLCELLKL